MASRPVGLEGWRKPQPGRRGIVIVAGALDKAEIAGLVKLNRLPAVIHNREGIPADNIACPELMLGLGRFPDPDGKLPVPSPDRSRDPERVAHIIVAALIKRPDQTDPRLNRSHPPLPG